MNVEPAWKTYLKVALGLVPTAFFWLFALMVIFPKVQSVWAKAGFGADGNQAPNAALRVFIDGSRLVFFNFYFLLGPFVLLLIILELWVKPWDRLRRPVLTFSAVLLNALLLLGLTVTIVAALVAADKLARGQ
jgi:hypothetical protein